MKVRLLLRAIGFCVLMIPRLAATALLCWGIARVVGHALPGGAFWALFLCLVCVPALLKVGRKPTP